MRLAPYVPATMAADNDESTEPIQIVTVTLNGETFSATKQGRTIILDGGGEYRCTQYENMYEDFRICSTKSYAPTPEYQIPRERKSFDGSRQPQRSRHVRPRFIEQFLRWSAKSLLLN